MWCNNCGRKQSSSADFCPYCGETRKTFSQTKPTRTDKSFALKLHLQSMAYYFMVLAGFLLVLAEVAAVAVYVVNVAKLIMQDVVEMERFYEAITIQEPFASTFRIVTWLIVGFFGASVITAGVFTTNFMRRILTFVSGGLTVVWLVLDIAGVTQAMGIDIVTGLLLLSIPLVASFVNHPYFAKSAVGTIVGLSIAAAVTLFLPGLVNLLAGVLFDSFGFSEFVGLVDPFLGLVAIAVVAIAHCSGLSRMSQFFSQVPDVCHPKRLKKEKVKKTAEKSKEPKKYKDIGKPLDPTVAAKKTAAPEATVKRS